jgi:hypothetical protein
MIGLEAVPTKKIGICNIFAACMLFVLDCDDSSFFLVSCEVGHTTDALHGPVLNPLALCGQVGDSGACAFGLTQGGGYSLVIGH